VSIKMKSTTIGSTPRPTLYNWTARTEIPTYKDSAMNPSTSISVGRNGMAAALTSMINVTLPAMALSAVGSN
jgi:hypothetical protein